MVGNYIDIYYRLKPLIPQPIRMSLRRCLALRKRSQIRRVWPILAGSEAPPPNWPDWPERKKFALVLTHDVEGPIGLEKCHKLMQLEQSLGFRSAFNFVPEGGYTVKRELLDDLRRRGFEIGVHDLRHDGRLYLSRKTFAQNAVRINGYLSDWGAVGFRSAFMFHKLDWLHDLNIAYDSSTFDTDPFEPQPQGRKTIFPFWVPSPAESNGYLNGKIAGTKFAASSGYVELPYTLPQDSTLFLLLRERHPDIWIEKLDWIAKHGGMAMVNVHPDYLRFENEPPSARNYEVEFYVRFLKYVRERYKDLFWQPLPREMAEYVSQFKPQRPRPPRRICMITHSYFLSDTRVLRYAESLAKEGDQVDVLSLQRPGEQSGAEALGNINIVRIQPHLSKGENSPSSYLWPLVRFFAVCSMRITREHRRRHYDLLHIHNIPDFLVFAAWYPKLTGAKIILDIHDIVPEFYASKFSASERSLSIRLLKWVERASAAFANRVIIANDLWLDKYAQRTRANGKCSVFINNVDASVFCPRGRTRNDGKYIVLFPGGLQWHQGLDIAIRAFRQVSQRVPEAEFHIYGDGNMKSSLVALADELGLSGKVRFFNPLPARQIAEVMANADLGVVPKRADGFGNEAYSTKIMEFMSVGVPVVVSSTKIDRYYFNDSVARFFESGNSDAMAEAMLALIRNPQLCRQMTAQASEYAVRHSWEERRTDYLQLIDTLVGEASTGPATAGRD